jgi:hypothetical protein
MLSFLLNLTENRKMGINICNLYSNQLNKHVYFCIGLILFK